MTTWYIYALCEPDLWQEIRYIGVSTDPKKRLGQHLSATNLEEDCPKNTWLRGLKAQGLKPIIRVLASTEEALSRGHLELEYIGQHSSIRLTNRYGNDAYWEDLWSRPRVMIPYEAWEKHERLKREGER